MHSMIVRLTLVTLVCSARIASAQVTPAATATPPDDTPSVKVGAVIYADYTYQQSPKIQDSDNNSVNLSSFNVTRSYINITGNISHIVAFRITPTSRARRARSAISPAASSSASSTPTRSSTSTTG
jgi:hypothetical protein